LRRRLQICLGSRSRLETGLRQLCEQPELSLLDLCSSWARLSVRR
jgi:hypothetical protein